MLLPLPLLNCYGIVLTAVISKCSWRFWFTCLGFGKCCSGLVNPQAETVRFSLHQNPVNVPLPHPGQYYFILMQKIPLLRLQPHDDANFFHVLCRDLRCLSPFKQSSLHTECLKWRLWNSAPVFLNNLSSIVVNGQNTQVVDPTEAFVFTALLMSQIPGFLTTDTCLPKLSF